MILNEIYIQFSLYIINNINSKLLVHYVIYLLYTITGIYAVNENDNSKLVNEVK